MHPSEISSSPKQDYAVNLSPTMEKALHTEDGKVVTDLASLLQGSTPLMHCKWNSCPAHHRLPVHSNIGDLSSTHKGIVLGEEDDLAYIHQPQVTAIKRPRFV